MEEYKVRHTFKAKSYLECGYNFSKGDYKIKAIVEGFLEKPINHDDENTKNYMKVYGII